MLRSVIGVVVGVSLGAIAVYVAEFLGHTIYPTSVQIDRADPEAMKRLVEVTPLGAKISVVAGWSLGAFFGGLGALAIARRWAPVAWVVAASILGLAATNFAAIPHPLWMQVGAVAGCGLGGMLAIRTMRGAYGPPPAESKKPFS